MAIVSALSLARSDSHWNSLGVASSTLPTSPHPQHLARPRRAPAQVDELWEAVAEPFIAENPGLGLPRGKPGRQLYGCVQARPASQRAAACRRSSKP
eukprot:356573-Chlamydomonas_euryale.AAC.2